ncbi:MAG: hypothetical protein ICV84_23175 [Flavisolibacter sp.]|nr:hypothetical protein [Flavisolibacter sp.]
MGKKMVNNKPTGSTNSPSTGGGRSEADFYIGWMPQAPGTFKNFLRKYLLALLFFVIAMGAVLALKQKKFSTAQFEFGKLTNVKGVYVSSPVPHLLIPDKNDYVMIPLVGYGKHGAEGVMQELQQEKNVSLENKELELKGTLLYGDGKILMQIDKNDDPLVSVTNTARSLSFNNVEKGEVTLTGEIIDPKCYFGVMKPGQGKPHKDCAIRCILGGIPPVLKITNDKGEKTYVLLKSSSGNINQQVKDFVATNTEISGHLKQYNNWLILDVNKIGSVATVKPMSENALAANCVSSCCKNHD